MHAMMAVKKYFSLVKFAHTIFAMPFAFIGFALGIMQTTWGAETFGSFTSSLLTIHTPLVVVSFQQLLIKFLLVLVCMVSARNAAMAFNRYLDRHFDAQNPRTALREIPQGIISPNSALRFTIANCVIFIIACYFINPLCFYLSPLALFVVLFYSYTKRFTPLCHLVLGLGLSLAPIGAYLAITGRFDLLPVLFSFAVILWVSGFDIIYALQDVDFDASLHLQSIPVAMGKKKALHFSELLHALSAACVIIAGVYGHFNWLYWIGVAVFIGMIIYQHSIVSPYDLSKVNLAFMTANGIASVVFSLLVIGDLLLL